MVSSNYKKCRQEFSSSYQKSSSQWPFLYHAFLLFILFTFSVNSNSLAAVKTFSVNGNFSVAANWGGTLPNAGDALVIAANCTVDNNALTDNVLYGTLTINSTRTLNWAASGTNRLNVTNVSAAAATGTINMSNGGKLIIRGTWTSTNLTFTPGLGTVEIQSSMTLPAAYTTYYNLIINGAGITVNSGIGTTINDDLTISSGIFTSNSFTNIVSGNCIISGTYNNSTAGTKTYNNITISSGGIFNATNRAVTINGNLLNSGTLTMGTGLVTFTGATSNTLSGSSTTSFTGGLTLNKGTTGTISDTVNVLDVQSPITLGNTTATALTLTRGAFKLSAACTIVPFVQTAGSTNNVIPIAAKLWCANASAIMDKGTVSFDWGIAGILQIDAGTVNVGIAVDDRIAPDAGGTAIIRINGGALNVAGRISFNTYGWKYQMTAGTLTVGIVGNSSPADKDPFNMDNAICSFSMIGGRIIIERAGGSGATSNLGYHNVGTSGAGFLGGTLQIGDASTPLAAGTMHIESNRPIYNLEIVNSNTTAQFWTYNTTITNNVTITAGVLDQGTDARDITVGGAWANNSSATAFVTGTRKVTFNGTAAQTIGGGFSTTFYDAEINNTTSPQTSATITLSKPTYISHALTMTNGYVNTDATNVLWMLNNSTATIGSANSFVNGPMNYNMAIAATARTLTFPIGKTLDWRPAVLTAKNTDATPITFNAEVFDASAVALGWTKPITVDTVSEVHYWDIKRYSTYPTTESNTTVSGNQTIQLYFGTNDYVKDGPNLTICKNTSASPVTWFDIGGSGAPAYAAGANLTGSVSSTSAPTAFTSFSRFTLASKILGWNPLPIELINFAATPCNNNVCLNWATATETNNDYFTIEKTKDGVNYEFVAKVKGAGNSTSTREYNTIDKLPYDGVSYYRLKQTDYNGNFTYSTLRMVELTNDLAAFSLNVYPNPSTGENISFAINADKGKEVLVVVFDVTGREAYSKVVITERSGENIFALDPSGALAKGLYLITATSDDTVLSKKLIVK